MQGTTAKELHYELTPFLCNNTTLFVKVCLRTTPFHSSTVFLQHLLVCISC